MHRNVCYSKTVCVYESGRIMGIRWSCNQWTLIVGNVVRVNRNGAGWSALQRIITFIDESDSTDNFEVYYQVLNVSGLILCMHIVYFAKKKKYYCGFYQILVYFFCVSLYFNGLFVEFKFFYEEGRVGDSGSTKIFICFVMVFFKHNSQSISLSSLSTSF